jgi:hypothetical protein
MTLESIKIVAALPEILLLLLLSTALLVDLLEAYCFWAYGS